MSEYVPTTDEIRYRVEHDWAPYGDGSFDAWLAAYEAQVRAEALREAADRIDLTMAYRYDDSEYRNAEAAAEIWLRLEADRIAPKGNETWAT